MNLILNLGLNIIGGVLAALIITYSLNKRRIKRLRNDFYLPLNNKEYIWHYKDDKNKTPRCKTKFTVFENRIDFKGEILDIKKSPFSGQILMDENLRSYGKGYYKDTNTVGFGFIELQMDMTSFELYIHSYFVNTINKPDSRIITHLGYIAEQKK